MLTLLLGLVGAIQPSKVIIQTPAPGIEYRMLIEGDLPRITTAIRFAPGANYWSTSTLARDVVYDKTPTNGRATMAETIATAGGIGGVNGDFFQWGNDPGGDPSELMIRNGELVSHPGKEGTDRQYAYGWGRGVPFVLGQPTWKASCLLGGKEHPLTSLNSYTAAKGLTLSTAAAGYAIAKSEPATFVVMDIGRQMLAPKGSLKGIVRQVVSDRESFRVNPGMAVLSSKEFRADLNALKSGDPVTIQVDVKGFDWKMIDQVMGGGPLLIKDGKLVSSADKTRHPRTAVGMDAKGGVWYAVIDGRQTMSVGATIPETAEIMRTLGCVEAMNLDGGGSSSIALFGQILNRPSGGVERAVANGVVWHGPKPTSTLVNANIVVQGAVKVGQVSPLKLELASGEAVPTEEVIWSAMGAGWIEADGTFHGVEKGSAVVKALYRGASYETKIAVE